MTDKKLVLKERLASEYEIQGSFEEKLEPLLTFLANPRKIWTTGDVKLRRVVLKLAFSTRVQCDRSEGARTPEISFSLKALRDLTGQQFSCGAGEGT